MKKPMKINWMVFSVVISVLFALVGCETTIDREFNVEYIFQNNSDYNIKFKIMGEIFDAEKSSILEDSISEISISKNKEHVFKATFPTNEKNLERPEGMLMQNAILGDSVEVIFDSERSLLFIKDSEKNGSIYLEEEYQYEKKEDYSFKYVFTFTNDDYENAILIEE